MIFEIFGIISVEECGVKFIIFWERKEVKVCMLGGLWIMCVGWRRWIIYVFL